MGKRKKNDGGGGGGYNWMDTYGDLVTLLLCFFVLLFASSNIDANKYENIVMSLTGLIPPIAFALEPGPANMEAEVQLTPREASPTPTPGQQDIEITPRPNQDDVDAEFDMLYQALLAYVRDEGLNDIDVNNDGREIRIRLNEQIFFDTGQAALKPDSLSIIDSIIPFLEQYEEVIRIIRVEGHTDNRPISTSQYSSNWWLSLARAGTVVEYLIDHSGISEAKLSADGRGEFNPIAPNDTEEGMAQNRRVEFVIEEIEVEYAY